MKHIYNGEFTTPQVSNEKEVLHSKIHWLLIYKEENNPKLDIYFSTVLEYLAGLNELLDEPRTLIDVMAIVQTAKRLNLEGCDFKKYRKLILDAHSKIDLMMEE